MNFNLKIIFFLFIFALLFIGCDNKPPISENKFIQVYVDLLILKDTTNTTIYSFDSLKIKLFEKHDISSQQYNSTLDFYKSNPEKWQGIFEKAISYAEEMRDSSAKKL
jgi:hypothetical protein